MVAVPFRPANSRQRSKTCRTVICRPSGTGRPTHRPNPASGRRGWRRPHPTAVPGAPLSPSSDRLEHATRAPQGQSRSTVRPAPHRTAHQSVPGTGNTPARWACSGHRLQPCATHRPRHQGREGQGRGSDHGRRPLAGPAVVARGAEPLADGTGVGLRRLGPGPARAGGPAVGDQRGDGRAVLPAVQVDRQRTDRGGPLDAGRGRHSRLAGVGCGNDFMRLAVAER